MLIFRSIQRRLMLVLVVISSQVGSGIKFQRLTHDLFLSKSLNCIPEIHLHHRRNSDNHVFFFLLGPVVPVSACPRDDALTSQSIEKL